MRELGKMKRQTFYRHFLYQEVNVLVEDRGEKGTGRWKGFSRNYIPVLLTRVKGSQGQIDWVNQEVRVKVTGHGENGLVGQVVEG